MSTWERQDEILIACGEHDRVAVRAGRKVSKSVAACCVAWWFFSSFPEARVVITGPGGTQVRRILWRELRLIARRSKIALPHVPETPFTGIISADGTREIIGLSTDEPERMQGYSGPHMLYIIDEASGVSEDIFEAIEGNLAGGARVLMIGNPTQPSGTFYDAFNRPEVAELWNTLHISSWEAAKSKRHIKGMATERWCHERYKAWGGPDGPVYQVHVMGEFAKYGECSVIPLAYVSEGQHRHGSVSTDGRLQLGVDPARFGDDEFVVAVRRGLDIIDLVARKKLDIEPGALFIEEMAARHHRKGEQKPLVKIDAAAMGSAIAHLLRARGNVDVVMVNFGDPSDRPDDFINMRAQLWFGLADWLHDGGAIPKDFELEADLLAPKYDFNDQNKRRIERKQDIKKRLKRSPDRGDAVCLAVHTPRVKLVHEIPARRAASSTSSYRWGAAGRGY